MTYSSQYVTVTVTYTAEPADWPAEVRWQPWHWSAVAPNGRVLAIASERYTNYDDLRDALDTLFAVAAPVRLVGSRGNAIEMLRGEMPTSDRPIPYTLTDKAGDA